MVQKIFCIQSVLTLTVNASVFGKDVAQYVAFIQDKAQPLAC